MFDALKKMFDAWTKDVGNTLKLFARTVWNAGFGLAMVIIGMSLVVGIPIVEEAESFWVILIWLLLTFFLVTLILTAAQVFAASVYAKGEIVHQLQAQTQKMTVQEPAPAVVEKTEKPQIKTEARNDRPGTQQRTSAPAAKAEDTLWLCKCGTANSTNYGMCKKCGSHRSSQ